MMHRCNTGSNSSSSSRSFSRNNGASFSFNSHTHASPLICRILFDFLFEIALCLMQDLETFCTQDSFVEKIYSHNKLQNAYQKSFYYFSKGCERNLKADSAEHELFELTSNYVDLYINRCSF